MWDLKYDANEPIYKRDPVTNTEERLVVVKREEGEGGSRKLGLADVSFHI